MKRVLSCVLSLCILLSCFVGVLTVPAAAVTEYVTAFSDDFESYSTGELAKWLSATGPTQDGTKWFRPNSSAWTSQILADGDNQCLALSYRAYRSLSNVLEAGKTYKITFSMKLANAETTMNDLHVRLWKALDDGSAVDGYNYIAPYINSDLTGTRYLSASTLTEAGVNADSWTEISLYYQHTEEYAAAGYNILTLVSGASTDSTIHYYFDNFSVSYVAGTVASDFFQDYENDTVVVGTNFSLVDTGDAEHGKAIQGLYGETSNTGYFYLNNANSKLNTFGYEAGETVYLSFDYKGNTNGALFLQPRACTSATSFFSGTRVALGSIYRTLATGDQWQTAVITLTMPDDIAEREGLAIYTTTAQSITTPIYLDNFRLFRKRKTSIQVEGVSESVIVPEVDPDAAKYGGREGAAYDLSAARVDDSFRFKLATQYVGSVAYNGTVLTPDANGVYTINKVQKNSTLTVQLADSLPFNNDSDSEGDALRVLAIGNSFTDDATALLGEIISAENKDIRIGKAIIGGSTLQMHADNVTNNNPAYSCSYSTTSGTFAKVTLQQVLHSADWDIITIQQASALSGSVGDYETVYRIPAQTLVSFLNEQVPNAEIVIHETWAYSTYRKLTDGAVPGDTQQAEQDDMFAYLQANYQQLSKDLGNARIIPVGTAMQLTREAIGDIVHRDNNPGHANFLGRLLGAYTYYAVLTGELPQSYDPMDPNDSAYIKYYYMDGNSMQDWIKNRYFVYSTSKKYTHDTEDASGNTVYEDKVSITAEEITENGYIDAIKTAVEQAITLYTGNGYNEQTTAQMRKATEAKQHALRFKVTIDTDIIQDELAGYELVEYGSLVTLNKYLTDSWKPIWFAADDSSINSAGVSVQNNGNAKVHIGRAYVKGDHETLWSVDGNKTVFTAALVRIGYRSDETIDYTKWGNEYYILPYAVYQKTVNGKTITTVKYGTNSAFSYSMFEMVQTIVDQGTSAEDITYVNSLFDADESLAVAWQAWGGNLDESNHPAQSN